MSNSNPLDAAVDADRRAFLAKRRAARRVKSRKRVATAGRGRGGSAEAAGANAHMDSLPSQNLDQKAPAPQSLTSTPAPISPHPTEREQHIAAGEIPCLIYAKPLNPRLLLVQFSDNSRGKVVIRPVERAMFGPGKRIWVKAIERGIYVLAGRYNRFGARC
jgi:hypothetical protein